MIKKNTEKYNLISIECISKKEKSNKIKLELVNNKRRMIEIYFYLFWEKDTPEGIIRELLDDTNIEICNQNDFINYLNIFNKKNVRIIKIQKSILADSFIS